MKIYTMKLNCQVCGGPGACDSNTMTSAYMGGFISHRDPRVCAQYLKKKEKLNKK